MAPAITTRKLRDEEGNLFVQTVLDVSGTGNGPYLPMFVPLGPDGTTPIDMAALATGAKQDALATQIAALLGYTDGIEGSLGSILTKLSADPSTGGKQDALAAQITTLLGYSDGIEGGLASILAKLTADPATQTTLAALLAKTSALTSAAPGYVADAAFVASGFQTVTVTSTAQTVAQLLTAAGGAVGAIPAGTKAVVVQPRVDGIRYAHGGSTPTTAADVTGIGCDILQGQQIPLRPTDLTTLKFIAPSNTFMSIEFKG